MESINNIASAATKAVWGEENTRREPISGVKGDVAKGEPFDAGNLEPARQEQVEHSFEGRSENTPAVQPVQENTALHQTKTDNVHEISSGSSEMHNTRENIPDTCTKCLEPSEAPINQDSGPFERSNSRVKEPEITDIGRKEPETLDYKSPEKGDESSKGTGQEYVRSTGLAADGGDFDATKPGAGREAERLMEEKGLHRDEDDSHASGGKDKPSLGERIKAKLHKH